MDLYSDIDLDRGGATAGFTCTAAVGSAPVDLNEGGAFSIEIQWFD